jgi:hypothetical protein
LPNFVVMGSPLNKHEFLTDPGYRGPRHQPLALSDPGRGIENLRPFAEVEDFDDRMAVLDQLEQGFARTRRAAPADAHHTALRRAVRLMRSEKARAFDLTREPDSWRKRYGESKFGQGCLLARRLVEVGVSFVEVYLQNWDTHDKQSATAARALMPQVDDGLSGLVGDLSERGLLDSTLIIWMGEFGRTPRINNLAGRDHHARAWSTVLVGGGVRGGSVVGKTDAHGATVTDRPISARDFLATVCLLLGIDPTRKIDTPVGRPISIVDTDARPIREVLG